MDVRRGAHGGGRVQRAAQGGVADPGGGLGAAEAEAPGQDRP